MGDVLTLIEEVQGKIDEQEAQEQLRKMTTNQFTLEDFRNQLGQFKKLGSMSKLMKMLPEQMTGGMQITDEQSELVDHQMRRTEAIIGSMTRQERNNYKVIDASRKTRIAGGSGSTIGEVNQLLRQYEQMRKMMVQMNKGGLFGGLARKVAGGMAGGLAGGLGNMLGGGSNPLAMLGGGSSVDYSDDDSSRSSRSIRKKKRHKKRR
jgi:signal recognition particle subunit SRP54